MAWTTPATQAAGFLVTASVYNTQIINNLKYLHGDSGNVGLGAQVNFSDSTGSALVGGDGTHSGYALVDSGTSAQLQLVGTVAGSGAFTTTVAGDSSDYRFTVNVDGTLKWGPGSGARDTTLARSAAGALKVSNVKRAVRSSITYSSSMTPDASAGEWQTITVTNSTAFTINTPTNPPATSETQDLVIEVFNNTGGAIGAVTWGSGYAPLSAGQPVNYAQPLAGKRRAVFLRWSGTVSQWVVINSTSTDY